MAKTLYAKAVLATLIFTLCVIMVGAYTRLSDSGLGCPDWPACYGKIVVPRSPAALAAAQSLYPHLPIDTAKAWTEMAHRYIAGLLGMAILLLLLFNLRSTTAWLLVGCVIFQAALGMWTVTLKLLPLVVTAHLLGGITLAALLWWLYLNSRSKQTASTQSNTLRILLTLGFAFLATQIFLGAWTSTNYAALACPTFPLCHGTLWPTMHWANAFNLITPIGPNYEGGHLAMDARVTIQMAHRYGAAALTLILLTLISYLILSKRMQSLRHLGVLLFILLIAQLTLGIINVVYTLPIFSALAHTLIATLLMLCLLTIAHREYHQ